MRTCQAKAVLMVKIRILLALSNVKGILSLKTMLMQQPDMEIVAEASDPIDVLLKVGTNQAEVVAIDLPTSDEDSGLCSHLLAEYPHVKIIAISEEGDRAMMYKTGMVRRQIPDTSLEYLVDLIRWSMINTDTGWNDMDQLTG